MTACGCACDSNNCVQILNIRLNFAQRQRNRRQGGKARTVSTAKNNGDGFVFDSGGGANRHARENEEQTPRAARGLSGGQYDDRNAALLAQLAEAKSRHANVPKRELLRDPEISALVNTLLLVNEGWVRTVIRRNIARRPHLRGASVDELYTPAIAGKDNTSNGTVDGAMGAILGYDYGKHGIKPFSRYLEGAINNALQQLPRQQEAYRQIDSRIERIDERGDEGEAREFVDSLAAKPDTEAANRELLEVVRSVIPRLPSAQQRFTAGYVIDRILATGERPSLEEVAQAQSEVQGNPVTPTRALQILKETVESIRRRIVADYPQLAQAGVGGWEEFKEVFPRAGYNTDHSQPGNGRA